MQNSDDLTECPIKWEETIIKTVRKKPETHKNNYLIDQRAKFVVSSAKSDDGDLVKSLIFITSYFMRFSLIRRKRRLSNPKIRTDQIKIRSVQTKTRKNSQSSRKTDGVLFLLGENEELVHHESKKESLTSKDLVKQNPPEHFFKVSLKSKKSTSLKSSIRGKNIVPLPFGISISALVLPGEIIQGCIAR